MVSGGLWLFLRMRVCVKGRSVFCDVERLVETSGLKLRGVGEGTLVGVLAPEGGGGTDMP